VGAFYVIGSVLAVWAVLVSGLGVLRKDFPGSGALERAVGVITAALMLAAISAAVIGASSEEEHEEGEGGSHEAALVLPR
jgi:hypothetical protein